VWEAEQKKAAAEKREKEMKELYEKEQERYRTRYSSCRKYNTTNIKIVFGGRYWDSLKVRLTCIVLHTQTVG
jgi:hypothetical protein